MSVFKKVLRRIEKTSLMQSEQKEQ
ncbi:uncharacterized protein METZ01_LOCUS191636 [marine metagenome]|uniref:Uncharacterized protein n=1 Tax=marine metagenome TaxID=408172 RepID=A0A382DL68_9ZZZZ